MGADYQGQERAIEKVKELPADVRELLSHHLRNPLTVILAEAQMKELKLIEKSVKHMIKDLERFGL
jgi:signal transduction histidine kinase